MAASIETCIKRKEMVDKLVESGIERTKAIDNLAETFGLKYETLRDDVRRAERYELDKEQGYSVHKDKGDDVFPILCIGDVHLPFSHKDYLQFCKDVYVQYGCKTVVCLGDMIDNHMISFHDSEVDAMGGVSEYEMAKDMVQDWVEAFPNVKYCLGNHDRIPERKAHKMGLSGGFIKSFHEQWDLPETWDVATDHIVGDVLFTHGINCNGKDGAYNLAVHERMSAVIGHAHSMLGCKYVANQRDIIFGMNVGCGIDTDSYAMRYGKFFKLKPTIGCGVVMSSREAYAIPMKMN